MSLETMTKLASTTVGVGGSSSIDFTNIPQGYTDLLIKVSARTAAAQGACNLSFNSLTSGLSARIIYGIGSGTPGSVSYSSDLRAGYIVGTDYTASIFCNNEIYVSGYSSSTYKSVSIDSVTETNATESYSMISGGLWSNSAPITSLSLSVVNNSTGVASSFTQHSTFTLYGIKNAAQTTGNSIKATGGNIVFDGTYVYHVFNSTGTFVPAQPILAETLIVAGGGGGGYGSGGGGGGAGGVVYGAAQSLLPTSYAVTVGAAGTGGIDSTSTSPTNGSNSAFHTGIAIGGGAGGMEGNVVGSRGIGQNGGCGGGGGDGRNSGVPPQANYVGGSSTQTSTGVYTGYGYGGGNANYGGGQYAGAGGGGAGGAGSTPVAGAGAGGVGTSLFSSWLSATGQGVNVSGTYYIAGGGGGAFQDDTSNVITTAAQGGYGGGGNGGIDVQTNSTYNSIATDGRANTGGGGGGGTNVYSGGAGTPTNPTSHNGIGGAGGSGIVIIRYKG